MSRSKWSGGAPPPSGCPDAGAARPRRGQRGTRGSLGLLGMLVVGSAMAGEPSGAPIPLAEPGAAAWRPLTFPSIERETHYSVAESEGRAIWRAVSECSSSGMVLPVEGLRLEATPVLSWRWRVDERAASRRERLREGDDFAARVYVVFRLDARRAEDLSIFERMRRGVGERLYGREMPGSSLNYVWANAAALGSDWPNPYDPANHMLALRSGEAPLSEWREESVDLLADYRRHLGQGASEIPEVLAIAIMSDSDDTCSAAAAEFGDLRLSPRPRVVPGAQPSDSLDP